MNLKQRMGIFRSQILMSRYEKAIQIGEGLIQQIIKKFTDLKIQTLYQNIKQQLQTTKKLHLNFQTIIDHDNNKQRKKAGSKWQGKQKFNLNATQRNKKKWQIQKTIIKKQTSTKIVENQQSNQNVELKEEVNFLNQESIIQQELHRQIILPLNMPQLFKLKTKFPVIKVSQNHIQNVLSYLKAYDFQLIQTLPQLNIKQMTQLSKQMRKRSILRGVMIFSQNKKEEISKVLQNISEDKQKEYPTLISIIKTRTLRNQQKQQVLQFE